MATKPNNAPDFPYVVIPCKEGDIHLLDVNEARGFAEASDADFQAKEWAKEGKQAIVYHAVKVYAQVTKTDVVWSR